MSGSKLAIFKKMKIVAGALLFGKVISKERMEKRLDICRPCEYVKQQGEGLAALYRCGICKCKLKVDATLINLARYEETNKYGCRHPLGSRWKKQGV